MTLEEWLGVDLFDRGSKPPRLTETGLWFRQAAQDLLAEVARVPGDCRGEFGDLALCRYERPVVHFHTALAARARGAHDRRADLLMSDVYKRCEAPSAPESSSVPAESCR